MTKSKRQLRAEAVERLRDCRYHTLADYIRAMLGWGHEPHFEDSRDALIDLLADDAHEARGSYEERLYDVPVSDCPYCGCKRVVIHDFNDIYEKPHSYRVEHVDEKEAFEAGCFETYYAFDSAEKAVEHANMRDPLTDEPTNGIGGETNGIADGSPLVDRDPVRIMRKVANGDEVTGYAMRKEVGGVDWADALLILADMVERDYVSREVYEDLRDEFTWETTFLHRMGKKCGTKDVPSLVAYVDKLEARVEELEAVDRRIAETDARWEAAIRDLERMTAERDELQKQLDAMPAPSGNLDAQSRAEIEDMERSRAVSGDAAAEVDAGTGCTEKTPQEPRECARITFTDTREKLEADVRKWFADDYYDDYYNEQDMNSVVSKWLDRQAAITERHWMEICGANANANVELKRQIDVLEANNMQLHTLISELEADNDYLRDRNEKLDYEVRAWKGEAKTQRNNFEQATEARKHWQREYETVKAERDELKSKADAHEADKASWQSGYHIDRIAKLQAQRDRYRDLLSKAVDEAQAIVKLMEVER